MLHAFPTQNNWREWQELKERKGVDVSESETERQEASSWQYLRHFSLQRDENHREEPSRRSGKENNQTKGYSPKSSNILFCPSKNNDSEVMTDDWQYSCPSDWKKRQPRLLFVRLFLLSHHRIFSSLLTQLMFSLHVPPSLYLSHPSLIFSLFRCNFWQISTSLSHSFFLKKFTARRSNGRWNHVSEKRCLSPESCLP